jgi:hypothetical protein
MQDKLIISINARGVGKYNSFIEFLPDTNEKIKRCLHVLLEIELMSGKESLKKNGYLRYDFNVTQEKEDELVKVFESYINEQIVTENLPSLN